jgi:hypothetical protein
VAALQRLLEIPGSMFRGSRATASIDDNSTEAGYCRSTNLQPLTRSEFQDSGRNILASRGEI